jgi:hypothetical protein
VAGCEGGVEEERGEGEVCVDDTGEVEGGRRGDLREDKYTHTHTHTHTDRRTVLKERRKMCKRD